MNREIKLTIIFCAFLVSGMIMALVIYPYRYRIKQKLISLIYHSRSGVSGSGTCENCNFLFPDNVRTHTRAYRSEGIKPRTDDEGIERLFQNRKLVKINSGESYKVRQLHHSKPYILPKGLTFIETLAQKYRQKCEEDSLEYVPFEISSVTRSKESVARLQKINGNSIENSAHLRGKTFDINYHAFHNKKKQNRAFIRVLRDLRSEGKCYVKYERNGCLHITVI